MRRGAPGIAMMVPTQANGRPAPGLDIGELSQLRQALARLKRASLEQSRDPDRFEQAAGTAVRLIVKACQANPAASSSMRSAIRKSVRELSELVQDFSDVWLADPALARTVGDLAASLDEWVQRLPPKGEGHAASSLSREVNDAVRVKLKELCSSWIAEIEGHLAKQELDAAFEVCERLVSWWPCEKRAAGSLFIAGTLTALQKGTVALFMRAMRVNDIATVSAIREFAQQVDDLQQKSGCMLKPGFGRLSDGSISGALMIGQQLQRSSEHAMPMQHNDMCYLIICLAA